MHTLKDLLKGAVSRANIGRQVTATQIVETANQTLKKIMPDGRDLDARALSYKNKKILIECRNSAASHFINSQSRDIIEMIKTRIPDCELEKINTRVVGKFSTSEL
ncbi:MAG: hypothetical protein ABIH21_02080 [Patescibacteria group bacterium]